MSRQVEILHLSPEKIRVEIAIGEGIFQEELPQVVESLSQHIAIIADKRIALTFGKALQEATGGTLYPFRGGEEAKIRETKQEFEDLLLKDKFGRDSLLIGLGGGVVTDFTAFLASTYMRGIPLLLVPTTLLAMVDAAIGGKTGVDTPFGKNLIGTIYQPSHIFIDPLLLSSLPDAEWTFGLSEILKYGLIADPSIWELLENDPANWKKSLHTLILSSIRAKKRVVEQDLNEKGLRRILNFGHTIAHAVEVLAKYKMPHGEAVAIGLLVESHLSHRLGYLKQNELTRITTLLRKFPFSFKLPKEFALDPMLQAMQIDKKAKGKEPRFVLIDRIGHPLPFDGEYCRPVPLDTLCSLIKEHLCLAI